MLIAYLRFLHTTLLSFILHRPFSTKASFSDAAITSHLPVLSPLHHFPFFANTILPIPRSMNRYIFVRSSSGSSHVTFCFMSSSINPFSMPSLDKSFRYYRIFAPGCKIVLSLQLASASDPVFTQSTYFRKTEKGDSHE